MLSDTNLQKIQLEQQYSIDDLFVRSPTAWLVTILIAYGVVASLFATQTPFWQSPDEPAHYNYIEQVALGRGLPVLQLGDYNQYYNEKIIRQGFPSYLSISPLRYENYQPPLYYLSAIPIYWLGRAISIREPVVSLRLYGVLLGAISLMFSYRCLMLIFPRQPLIPLGAVAFSGLLPMHVAMMAAVNNDGLAELLLLAATLVLLGWMREQFTTQGSPEKTQKLLLLGFLLGLGLLTKIYAYAFLPIVLLFVFYTAIWQRNRQNQKESKQRQQENQTSRTAKFCRDLYVCMRVGISQSLTVLLPALMVGAPLWIRNSILYGSGDPLGLQWHDLVVAGQPTTKLWIAQHGWVAYWERAFTLTFQSFWGVFGWLGVFLDARIYTALMLFCGVLFLGLLWALVRFMSDTPSQPKRAPHWLLAQPKSAPTKRTKKPLSHTGSVDIQFQYSSLILFVLTIVVVLVSYILYNFKFVQHQGRYFFWGLLAISTFVALGWRELQQPTQSMITGVMASVLTASLGILNIVGHGPNKWTLLSIGLIAVFLLLQPLLLINTRFNIINIPSSIEKSRIIQHSKALVQGKTCQSMNGSYLSRGLLFFRSAAWATPFILLFLLDLICVFWYIAL